MDNRKENTKIRFKRRKKTTKSSILSSKPKKETPQSNIHRKNSPIITPLEVLLPKIEGSTVFVPNPFLLNSRFIHSQIDSHDILQLRLNENNRGTREVSLYDSSEFFLIRGVAEKDNLTLSPHTFQGEIGERVMRASLEQMCELIKNKNPGFKFNFFKGVSREVITVNEHYILAFGKFDNVYLYETESEWVGSEGNKRRERLHNPLYSDDNDKLVGTIFNKERYRGCFRRERAEIDGLVKWEYQGKRGLIICESKTGRKTKIRSSRRFRSEEEKLSYDYEKRISPLLEIFPGYEISYLVMGCKGAVYLGKKMQMIPRLLPLFDFLGRKNIPFIVLGFEFNSNEFVYEGEYVHGRYINSLSEDRNWKNVTGGSYDSKQGVMSLKLGSGERMVLTRDKNNPELYHKITPKGEV